MICLKMTFYTSIYEHVIKYLNYKIYLNLYRNDKSAVQKPLKCTKKSFKILLLLYLSFYNFCIRYLIMPLTIISESICAHKYTYRNCTNSSKYL